MDMTLKLINLIQHNMEVTFSSFLLLFNQTAIVKYFDFCHKDINGIKINKDLVKKNFQNIFRDFKAKTENFKDIGNLDNIEKNFKLFTEIQCKTTDNSSVNIYILNQIEEIFIYSIIMEVATTVNTNEEDKKGANLELLDEKLKSSSANKVKEEKLYEQKDLRDILEIIKEIISVYESKYPKSKMALFQSMLNESISSSRYCHTSITASPSSSQIRLPFSSSIPLKICRFY